MRHLAAVLVLVLAGITLSAADLSGTWAVTGDVVGNAVDFSCVLKQDGEALTGTATIAGQDVSIKGSVKDRAVTYEFDVDYNGSTYNNVYTGTLGEDGVITGTIAVGGVEGTFTAKRQ